ncbi:MAG: hypothetical protein IPP74_11200 [Alphaproteobacteria bacterium]|nr:hypothetical protein [Alphaproteobacteria bacterium]
MPQLDPSSFASQLFWLALTFSLLFVVLSVFLLPRIRGILEHRQSTIEAGLAEARAFRDLAESALFDYQSTMSDSRSEGAKIMQEAALLFQKESAETLASVEKDIETRLAQAEKSLTATREKALASAKEASLSIAQTVVKTIAGFDANSQSLRALLQEVE